MSDRLRKACVASSSGIRRYSGRVLAEIRAELYTS